MAVDYVYALHEFVPQNDDEIDFEAGERIEVIEKDDLYGDGWWTGRNLAGRVGIFPKDYTTPARPLVNDVVRAPTATASFGTLLQPLTEENETTEIVVDNGAVMAATMTDVQAAIDQLGQHRNDDGQSISFASTRDDRASVLGHGLDLDDLDGEEWHRDARRRLFEGLNAVDGRHSTPPVDVEVSDESDADDEHPHLHHLHDPRPAPSPPKETHGMKEQLKNTYTVFHRSPSPLPSSDHSSSTHQPSTLEEAPNANNVPPSDAPELPQAEINLRSPLESPASPTHSKGPSQGAPIPAQSNTQPTTPYAATPPISPVPDSLTVPSISHASALPSATTLNSYHSAPALPQPSSYIPELYPSRIYPFSPTSNLVSTAINRSSSGANSALVPPLSAASTAPSGPPSVNPSEWTIEQVVEWARNRGFDDGVCAKFQEHEITGDVLLEFDVHMLKEIDIPPFGKRMRIASAIQELRRPASITSSDAASVVPHRVVLSFPNASAHSYNSSLSSAAPHSATSPFSYAQMQQQQTIGSGYNGGEMTDVPEMEPRSRADSEPGTTTAGESVVHTLGNGSQTIGPGATVTSRNRPMSLVLSNPDRGPHAPMLAPESDIESRSIKRLAPVTDERAVLSEGEGKRRKDLAKSMEPSVFHTEFGAMLGSPASKSRLSLDRLARPRSSQTKEKNEDEGRHRLSFFSTSIGRNRKPAPRYSSDQAGDYAKRPENTQLNNLGDASNFLSSLNLSEAEKSKALASVYYSNSRLPWQSTQGTKGKEKEVSMLRKRTNSGSMSESAGPHPGPWSVSAAGPSGMAGAGGVIKLKPGAKVLDQFQQTLGEADFSGWMMKKGERYNTWKMRFFYLKGPHMYYLRSITETKVKGYINITGYKVVADDTINPGRYGFRIFHDVNKSHAFASDEHAVIRDWMKALMKATIGRDYTRPVISSANVPTIPLTIAQAMNPAPRPPSPTQRDAVQRAMRAGAPIELSPRDARVLMGVLGGDGARSAPPPRPGRLSGIVMPIPAPARPSREMRKGVNNNNVGIVA